jgi:hypothetical protein
LYRGRETLISFADEYVASGGGPRVPAGGNRPVVVLEGCGGSGRTSTLEAIAEEHGAAVPLAQVDARKAVGLSAYGDVSGLLLLAAFGMSDGPKETPRIHFHRLFVAHTALAQEIDLATGPDNVGREMRAALARYRNHGPALELAGQLLTGTGVAVLGQLKGVPPLGDLAESIRAASTAAMSALSRSTWLLRRTLSGATRWFGGEEQGQTADPILAMIELNTWRQTKQQNKIDRKLVSAFRADLEAGLPDHREYDCELLLDHADNRTALKFLRYLVAGRQLPDSPPDPLTVFAASGGNLMAALQPPAHLVRQGDEADLATVTAAELAGLSWLRVRLGPLSAPDVYAMIPTGPDFAGIDDEWLARVVLANTGGHPGAVRRFVDALMRNPDLFSDVDALLDTKVDKRATLAESILRMVTSQTDPDNQPTGGYLDTFTTLAAARHADEADRIVAGDKLVAAKTHDIEVLQAETLWPPPRPGAPGHLLPVARFLLLRILGRRPAEADDSWVNLFAWLSEHTPSDDPVGRLHHRFAMGEPVGEDLGAELADCTAAEWLERLDEIVATPDLRAGGGEPVTEEWGVGEKLADTIDYLLLALRELSDPRLTDSVRFRDRCLQITDLYLQLSRKASRGAREFRQRASHYRALADTYL